MTKVQVRGLTKRFGPVEAVSELDLDIDDGELLILLGPSGCGKSTILRMIAGLEAQSSGSIKFDGRSVVGQGARERDVAFVFQSYALYPQMTVRQNLSFPLVMEHFRWWFHIPLVSGIMRRWLSHRPEIREQTERVADELGLSELINRRPRALSGGQRQRVALGRAMVRNPSLFLLDEPLSNLDAVLRLSARGLISKLHRDRGATLIYVTHDQVEAMTLGTRIVILDKGVCQQVDTPRGIYERPANTFVASFVGAPPMNLVKATVTEDTIQLLGDSMKLPPAAQRAIEAAGMERPCSVTVGIRPEHVRLGQFDDGISVQVRTTEDTGSESIVSVCDPDEASSRGALPAEALYIRHLGQVFVSPDMMATVMLEPEKIVLFDATSGDRLPDPTEGRPSGSEPANTELLSRPSSR